MFVYPFLFIFNEVNTVYSFVYLFIDGLDLIFEFVRSIIIYSTRLFYFYYNLVYNFNVIFLEFYDLLYCSILYSITLEFIKWIGVTGKHLWLISKR
ncbi:hypothetical protein PNEJI1_m005022 (mitochondrion) [Pneumocystis jirovecii]|uniref:Uncharacterized protein n=1 Tax=Pneumocystis jirovecii TaxID=42068 RepID=L0PGW5_PNEJI|nr:hypothetical protein PNEJI1_m005022 [Pneumocystis jirovecii]